MLKSLFGILWGRILLIILLLPILGYAIVQTYLLTIGPLENALWKKLPGIKRTEDIGYTVSTPIPIIVNFGHEVEQNDLLFVQEYTQYLTRNLPANWSVVSLATYQLRSWDDSWGETMEMWSSYISPMHAIDENFSMETWKENVQKNPAVYGTFVGHDFHYAVIMVEYPARHKLTAIREFRRVLQRHYPPENATLLETIRYYINDYLDTDFVPYQEENGPEILVGSLSVTEALVTWAFFLDVGIKITCGYIVVLLFLLLMFKNWDYALAVWTATLFAFLATIAAIWPLSLLQMNYSVFLLPTLVGGVLIAAVSFHAQIIEEIKRVGGVTTYKEWKKVTLSVRKSINHIFCMTIICFAIFGFVYQSLWTAVVMDTVLIIGSTLAWLTQRYFFPALYFFFKKHMRHTPTFIDPIMEWLEIKHERWIEHTAMKINGQVGGSNTPYLLLLLLPVIVASILVISGYIDTNSRQLTFLGNNHARAMLENMSDLGRLDVIPLMFEDTRVTENPLQNREVYSVAHKFTEKIGNGVASIIPQITFEMTRDDGLAVPYEEALNLTHTGAKESNMTQWVEWKNAIIMFVDHPMDNAYDLHNAIHNIQSLAENFQNQYEWLQISLFGDMLHYPLLAKIIATQTPWVLISSLFALFLYYSWMTWKECKYISPCQGGFIISQGFLFVGGVIIMVMGIFGIPLNIATAAIVPVVIGASADANVYPAQEFFYLLKHHNKCDINELAMKALRTRGKAVNIDCTSNVIILSLLMLSSFSPVRNLGLLACLSLITCRWWSINFTLPQLVHLYEKHKQKMEVRYENITVRHSASFPV